MSSCSQTLVHRAQDPGAGAPSCCSMDGSDLALPMRRIWVPHLYWLDVGSFSGCTPPAPLVLPVGGAAPSFHCHTHGPPFDRLPHLHAFGTVKRPHTPASLTPCIVHAALLLRDWAPVTPHSCCEQSGPAIGSLQPACVAPFCRIEPLPWRQFHPDGAVVHGTCEGTLLFVHSQAPPALPLPYARRRPRIVVLYRYDQHT